MEVLRWSICIAAIVTVAMAATRNVPNMQVMYDNPVNLTCMDQNINPDTSIHEFMWLLPNGDLVKKTDDHKRVMIYEEGKQIKVKKVDDEDFGIYNCIIYVQGTQNYIIIQKGVNLNGPFWGNLLAKYQTNLIVGCVSSAIVFILLAVMCYFMNREHIFDQDEDERVKASNLWISKDHSINNPALELDEEKSMQKVPPINVNVDSSATVSASKDAQLATKL